MCDFRTPTPHQWWVHPFWVGVIEAPSEAPGVKGEYSEARICASLGYVKVRFLGAEGTGNMSSDFTHLTDLGYLRQLHFGTVEHSPWFASDEAGQRALYEFSCRCGLGDRYKPSCDYCRVIEAMTGTVNCPIHSAVEVAQ